MWLQELTAIVGGLVGEGSKGFARVIKNKNENEKNEIEVKKKRDLELCRIFQS